MKWMTRLLPLLAICMVAFLVAMVSGLRKNTPGVTLGSIEEALGRGDYNHITLLRSLDTALANSQSSEITSSRSGR